MPSSEKSPSSAANSNYRKSTKPLMEKRRRARINNCLSELKAILLDTMKKDNAQASKMEKADILEMTVRYLRGLQRQRMQSAVQQDPSVINKYRLGFTECAGEVTRYLTSVDGISHELRARMLSHLAHCIESLSQAAAVQQQQQQQIPQQQPQQHQFSPISTKSSAAAAPSQQQPLTPQQKATLLQPAPIRPTPQGAAPSLEPGSAAAAAASLAASLKNNPAVAGVPSYVLAREHAAAVAAAAAAQQPQSSRFPSRFELQQQHQQMLLQRGESPYSPPIRPISPVSCPPPSSSTPSPVNLSTGSSASARIPVSVFCPPPAISPVSSSSSPSSSAHHSPVSSEGSLSPGRPFGSFYSVKAEPLTPPYSAKSVSPAAFAESAPIGHGSVGQGPAPSSSRASPAPEFGFGRVVGQSRGGSGHPHLHHPYPLPPKKSYSSASAAADNLSDKQSLWRPF